MLPYVRGSYPGVWAFFEGTQKGVTIFYIDEGLDSGDIIAQKEIKYPDDETLFSSYHKRIIEVENLLIKKWEDIISGKIEVIPQKIYPKGLWKNKEHSEKLMKLFPQRWHTRTEEVEKVGAEFSQTRMFWIDCKKRIRKGG